MADVTSSSSSSPDELNRAGRREQARQGRRLRKTGAALAAIPAAFGTTAIVLGAAAGPAGALPLEVTNLNKDGAGSLHDVVEGASDGDVITFQAGLTGTINLDDTIDITAGITIAGPGAGVITVSGDSGPVPDGTPDVQVFDIHPGSEKDVIISGLTITKGTAVNGGAIWFDTANLTLTDDVISDNSASGDGGAIASDDADIDLTIRDSQLTGNTAGDDAGAVYFYVDRSNFLMTNSVVSGNSADGTGGGVLVACDCKDGVASVTIEGGEISDNTASDGRGGGLFVYNVSGDVSITGTTISGNTATGGGGGIGIQYVLGETTFTDLVVSDNHVPGGDDGGGVYFEYMGDTTITGSTFTGNTSYDGGAIEWIRSGNLLLRNSTLSGNTSVRGGGIYNSGGNYGNVTIVNSTISGNTATGTNAGNGGAIFQGSYYTLTIIQSTITDNTGADVGGIQIRQAREQSTGLAANNERQAARDAARADARAAEGRPVTERARTRSGLVHKAFTVGSPVGLVGSIVSGNHGPDIGLAGSVLARSNILGTISGTTLNDVGGNQIGVNPLLGPLQDNGGPTQTHELLPGSPAIDTGPNPPVTFPGSEFDQRGPGYDRVVNGLVDVGAFEVQPPPVIEPTFTG